MKRVRTVLLPTLLALVVGLSGCITPVSVNFDDVTAPCLFIDTVALRNEYATLGVTFEGPGPNDGGAILDECSNFAVSGHSSPNFLAFNTGAQLSDGGIPKGPEKIKFRKPTSKVSIRAGSGLAEGEPLTMKAYNALGALVGQQTITLTSQMQTLSIEAGSPLFPTISYVVIESTAWAFVLDNLTWLNG